MSIRRSVIRLPVGYARQLVPRQTARAAAHRAATTFVRHREGSFTNDTTVVTGGPKHEGTSIQDDLDEIRTGIRFGRHGVVDLALQYVSRIPSSSSGTLSPGTMQRYSDLFNAFLSAPTPQSMADLLFILARINNNATISHEIILKVATLALARPDMYIALLEQMLPMPRTSVDTPLIARIVPSLKGHGVPETEISELIRARLASHPDEVQSWPGYLWQHLISFCDLGTAYELLEQYKRIVRLLVSGNRWEMEATLIESVSKPFAATLRQWCTLLPVDRHSSRVPSQIARELIKLIGDERLPVLFLNQWLNAERIAGNHETAMRIWERFDITTNMYQHSELPRPDRQTWTTYFKLDKSSDHRCARQTWKALFSTVHPQDITSVLLNSALSALMTSGRAGICHDLPALLFLLSKYDCSTVPEFGPSPDARTVDIVAAGLIRLWREEGSSFDRLFVSETARYVRAATRGWLQNAPPAYSTHPLEWKLVEEAVREMMPLPVSQRNQPRAGRAKLPDLLPMAGVAAYTRPDGKPTKPVECVTPAEMLLPMMQLVERAIRLLLARKADTDEQLDKAYKAMWAKVQDDILGSDEEALSHAVHGPMNGEAGQDMAEVTKVMRRIFGAPVRDRGNSLVARTEPGRAWGMTSGRRERPQDESGRRARGTVDVEKGQPRRDEQSSRAAGSSKSWGLQRAKGDQ